MEQVKDLEPHLGNPRVVEAEIRCSDRWGERDWIYLYSEPLDRPDRFSVRTDRHGYFTFEVIGPRVSPMFLYASAAGYADISAVRVDPTSPRMILVVRMKKK